MAIDQVIADCLALDAQLVATQRRDGERMISAAEAATHNAEWTPGLQALVDELARTEPAPERVYELLVVSTHQGPGSGSHYVLLCSDRRVVYAEVETGQGVRLLQVFPHGVLDVRARLMKMTPQLTGDQHPLLIWPRLAGSEEELAQAVIAVQPAPMARLQVLLERLAAGAPPLELRLVATPAGRAGGAVGPAAASPAGWHPDPAGRHEHRYWNGSRWTEHAADAGVAVVDPL